MQKRRLLQRQYLSCAGMVRKLPPKMRGLATLSCRGSLVTLPARSFLGDVEQMAEVCEVMQTHQ